jgi:hypothetical protein
VTVSAIGSAVQGQIDAVVNGQPYSGPFEATLCDPPAPVCPVPVPPPFSCEPAVAAGLSGPPGLE